MIVYKNDVGGFHHDILSNQIENIIQECLLQTLGHGVGPSELRAYHNSLSNMDTVLAGIVPANCGVSIEYNIPSTGKRIDFMLSGFNEEDKPYVIIVELKQWNSSNITSKDGIVTTYLNGREREVTHPSYQASTYADLLYNFNSTISNENIGLKPCAYLHNYLKDDVIRNKCYEVYYLRAPVFIRDDVSLLQAFIKKYIKKGDNGGNIIVQINNGKIEPTKGLCDAIGSMLKGNIEFILPDDQKIVYENLLAIASKSTPEHKDVIIVQGGPGTGKSVVAINLLVELIIRKKMLAQYVTKTSAPRDVYFAKLLGDNFKLKYLKSLFVGSGSFQNMDKTHIQSLIVDESHRLTEKTGFMKRGENQIKEIINAANCSIFFIDEGQHVSIEDYGSVHEIINQANLQHATIHYGDGFQLISQFRCNGSNGYLDWLNQTLSPNIKEQITFCFDFDFKVFGTPEQLRDAIFEKNSSTKHKNKARLVAGYCWNWEKRGQNNDDIKDIQIGDNFAMSWNMFDDGGKFIINENAINQVGCIHTAQGLETDYIGVIIGDDMFFKDGKVCTDVMKRADSDHTVLGRKSLLKKDPDFWSHEFDTIIRNTYKVLMTRGMKGCYIYCTDKALSEYIAEEFRTLHKAPYITK